MRTLNVMEGGWVWNKFIARICPYDEDDNECVKEPEKKLDVIKNLVEILKLVEDPKVLLTDLLELICERCSSKKPHYGPWVSVVCCRHSEPHVLPLVCQTYIDLKDREDVELFKVFMQFQPGVDLGLKLKVTGPIGGDGWAVLALALEIPPHVNIKIVTSKADLDQGGKEDMRKIWNVIRLIVIVKQIGGWALDVDKELDD